MTDPTTQPTNPYFTGSIAEAIRYLARQYPGEMTIDCARAMDALADRAEGVEAEPFQSRVQPWMLACFGPEISADRIERNHRFLEEALELVQANGCTQSEAHQLVDYVYGRPQGDINQEVGGVMVTLAALCLANGEDMHSAGEKELARVWTKVEQIRAKQAAKPRHSPLPGPAPQAAAPEPAADLVEVALEAFGNVYEGELELGATHWTDNREHAMREVVRAIGPRIGAQERERCAKVAYAYLDAVSSGKGEIWHPEDDDPRTASDVLDLLPVAVEAAIRAGGADGE